MIIAQLQRVVSRALLCTRWQKRAIMLCADAVALPILLWCAYALRFSSLQPPMHDLWLFPMAVVISLVTLYLCGFYRSIVRYLGAETAWAIVVGMSLSVTALAALSYMVPAEVPRSVFLIFWVLSVLCLGGSRFVVRRVLFRLMRHYLSKEPVAIFGAGAAGAQLATALQNGRELAPVLLVDDDPGKQGTLLSGVPVVSRERLEKGVQEGRVNTVLLAVPSLSRCRRMEIVRWLERLDVRVQTVPGFEDIASGRARLDEIQSVAIEDLLGRDPVPPRLDLLSRCIEGKVVMVTGAGGSIGSELCRQIVKLHPRRLVLLEQSELALYNIERELARDPQGGRVDVVPVLGSVVNRGLVRELCESNAVKTLYHAAAYKHVPIVEGNPAAGVRNNIIGTLAAARGAQAAGVERFILISTDKAVRPTNVMGATKRFAEMVLQAMATKSRKTIFTMVRFGNVLGSSGSVVPLFREQIRKGGPVTVTHPDIIRYFMTIPEASQLVIQAGAMAEGGEVFVLDMGAPVRIHDLAQTMIRLMGLTVRDEHNPDGDVEIVFSGLRPGEKLYEELLIGDASTRTEHSMIMQAHEVKLSAEEIDEGLEAFRQALERGDDDGMRALLRSYVSGYQPNPDGKPATVAAPAAAPAFVGATPVSAAPVASMRNTIQ